jgi:hypothetical protein
MSDAVVVSTILETPTHLVLHCANISDGTGESDAVKADKSALLASDGAEPASLDIERVAWNCDGMAVRVEWKHTVDDLALALSGNGVIDFSDVRNIPGRAHGGTLNDPRSDGGTGDVVFTTVGHSSGDTYNITMWLRKRPD